MICFGLFLKTFRVVLHLTRSWNNYFTSHFSFIQKCNNLFMSTLKTQIKKRKKIISIRFIKKKKRAFSLRYQVSSWTFGILELLWSEIQIIHYTLLIQSESVDLKLALFICILKSNFIIWLMEFSGIIIAVYLWVTILIVLIWIFFLVAVLWSRKVIPGYFLV